MTSPVHLAADEQPRPDVSPGFRLDRLELLNWGTFDQKVWTLRAGGANTLLTGDIGSGKSTVVDAVTTLLLPAQRISYNKAAGADTRERSLRSYAQGHWRSERNEATGTTRQVGLRAGSTYSVLLAVFTNPGYDATVTLAQVFWLKDGDSGQPDRFYVTADGDLAIAADFADFGTDVAALKRRLRGRAGASVQTSFPEYGRDYRRRLGIDSEQALELFHQTVSMKAVSDLNGFVRSHMLEPFDAAGWIDQLVGHFDDLTRAHESVVRARTQLDQLRPVLTDADAHDRLAAEIAALDAQREALPVHTARLRAELLAHRIEQLRESVAEDDRELARLADDLGRHRARERELIVERAGHGGDRLARIDELVDAEERALDARRQKAATFGDLLTTVGLDPVADERGFSARRAEIRAAAAAAESDAAEAQNRLRELAVDARGLQDESDDLRAELASLRQRTSSLPRQSLELRQRLVSELGIPGAALPLAGELIQVAPAHRAWEGAAERLLRGFALSLLVPDEHYPAVSRWIDAHDLRTRLVYYRVPARVPALPALPSADSLAAKLEIKDSAVRPWLEAQLAHRADHACVDSIEAFQRTPKALTRAGQIKEPGGRHEKNDATRIDDRRSYVLGWSNAEKIEALLAQAQRLQERLNRLADDRARVEATYRTAAERGRTLSKLDVFDTWSELDWPAVVRRIADLTAERERLLSASGKLGRIDRELGAVRSAISETDGALSACQQRRGGHGTELADAEQRATAVAARLGTAGAVPAQHLDALAGRAAARPGGPPTTLPDVDAWEEALRSQLTDERDQRAKRQSGVESRLVRAMARFIGDHPVETSEMDASVAAADEFRALHERLTGDDLPRFEATFKRYLNENTIRDIAGFLAELNKRAELIAQRVATINASLVGIDYNPGRYIRLDTQLTPHPEIKDFKRDLRACTDDALADGDDQYSEQRFLQVKAIVERLRGRPGHADVDRNWSRFVTDVRNWFVFTASERWREDDTEYETYSDSGGKSGGQKEKLAYTILAASLAYQFRLDPAAARSKTFRFVVIDEAFGRGSDESTRFALTLFTRLGLQLLIVTPLQKIHVIEPHVAAVGFVDNPTGRFSRLQSMTIEEYREQQALRRAAGDAG
ncbi:ATP-binding protein [Blastococcus sp. BMG 814]|uniref:ATP-binding protein n=1 Tax=Blastococcus carthaginiensis TaxID=3050034 RepID=A0ABT9IHQ8_9ACTN|nr:SbcC/MukB-like Walker B domain-containing protein [Blastococcus carthaginiensis]MDP5185116.1 ATP-binding protein [Blastococcus carthaginiensis]